MIELLYWPTPNGLKITVALEELELPYRATPINIGQGEQFTPDFLRVSPNNRIPALVDHTPNDGGAPVELFESGAILIYLAEKTQRLMPPDVRGRSEVLKWLFWQVGGLGPMAGQAGHFRSYAPEKLPYAIDRYTNEVNRLYGVLNRRLEDREFVAGSEFSIADIAIYPWAAPYERYAQDLADFPHMAGWLKRVGERPGVARGMNAGAELRAPALDEEAKKKLFGQTASSVDAAKASRSE